MRAPPERVTETSGTPRSAALSQARDELLADDAAHRAAHEGEVHDGELARRSSIAARPITIASPSPVVHLGLGETLGVGPEVEEAERIGRAQLRGLLHEESGSAS